MDWLTLIDLYFRDVAQLNWQLFTIIALLVYGYYQYAMDASLSSFRKELSVPNEEASIQHIINYMLCGSSTVVAVVCGVYSLYHFEFGDKAIQISSLWIEALVFGLLQGVLFYIVQYSRFVARSGGYSREFVHSVSRLNIFIVLLFGYFILGEGEEIKNSLTELTLIAISIYLLSEAKISKEKSSNNEKVNIDDSIVGVNSPAISITLYLSVAIIASACIQILSKYAVGTTDIDIMFFMFVSNVFTSIGALYICFRSKYKLGERYNGLSKRFIRYYKKGIVLGLINLIAFYSILTALSMKGASVVIPLYSLYILVPIILSTLINGYKLTERVTLASMLSILAIFVSTQNPTG